MSVRLAHLDSQQLDLLLARAEQLRQRSNAPAGPLDVWIDRVQRKDARRFADAPRRVPAVVGSVLGASAWVQSDTGLFRAELLGQSVVVGDDVVVALTADDQAAIVEVAPRRTVLSRPDVAMAGVQRAIVANVDAIVIVVSVGSPPLHPRLIDRYLIAIQQGGAQPLVFVNKLDLLTDPAELEVLDPYRDVGVPVFTGSAARGEGFDDLMSALAGKSCAFVGHSGVGKSSIVNRLKPDAQLDTGGVSDGSGKGTHTTTTSSLHRLADGTTLIDTPGVRSFGLRVLSVDEVADYFPEFSGRSCRFADCSHLHEPDCAVLDAVDRGEISAARYDAYRRLHEELGG
jgi:ribosome biogenesis GTPase